MCGDEPSQGLGVPVKGRLQVRVLVVRRGHEPADEEDYPILGRMTNVTDNVE